MRAVKFSKRTGWDTRESDLAQATSAIRRAGQPLLDMARSNPTLCGFHYDERVLLSPLTNAAALTYDPDPRGLLSARKAVAQYYSDHSAGVLPEQILLTTSTSEAYSFLFRLLCDPGDEVLVAQPSYPLFDYLAELSDVTLRSYPLFQDFGWWIDFAELARSIGPRTRAILLVHPNNPTGHFTSTSERHALEAICVEHGLALIVDEVFLDYALEPTGQPRSFATAPHVALTFVVSGLSKIAALPQMKVGWLAALGPQTQQKQALDRLEIIADTFLSMNAPAQLALPAWLTGRGDITSQILARIRINLAVWREHDFNPLPMDAGWSAILKLPAWLDARPETIARELGIIVHAGEFFGMSGRGWIVVSLIVETANCQHAAHLLAQWRDTSRPV